MVNQQLVTYFQQQINQGYDVNSVRNYLLGLGYDQKVLDQIIAQLPPDPKITKYIQQQVAAGYDKSQIRDFLIHYGYQASQIDKAFPKPNLTSNHKTMLITSIIVIASISFGIAMFFLLTDTQIPEVLLDYSLTAPSTTISPGEDLRFTLNLDSKGANKRYDVIFTHYIYNDKNTRINEKTETIAIETSVSKSSQIEIPIEATSGRYTLRSIGKYNGEIVQADFTFKVEKIDIPDEIESKPVTEKPNPTLIPVQIINENETTLIPLPTPPTTQIRKLPTLDDIRTNIKSLASNPVTIPQAVNKCNSLRSNKDKDACILVIVDISKHKPTCEKVQSPYRRDVCYVNNFVIQGDYSVCSTIIDPDLKLSCEQLSQGTGPAIIPTAPTFTPSVPTTPSTTTPINQTQPPINQTQPPSDTPILNQSNATIPIAAPTPQAPIATSDPEPIDTTPQTPPTTVTPPTADPSDIDEIDEILAETDPTQARLKCSQVTDKDTCYEKVGAKFQDSSLCALIVNIDKADDCYLNYAAVTSDTGICPLIINDLLKQRCEFLA